MNQIMSEGLSKATAKWKKSWQKMDEYTAKEFIADFDSITHDLDVLINEDPEGAIGFLIALVITVSEATKADPTILDKLYELVKKLKERAVRIAKETGAEIINISAGLPLGISVGITYTTKDHK